MDTHRTIDRLLDQVEGHASEVERLSRGQFLKRMHPPVEDLLVRIRNENSAAVDTLEKLTPFEDGMDETEHVRLAAACLRTRTASLYGLCLAGLYDRARESIAEIERKIHPDARDTFSVRAGAFLVLLATLREDPDSAERAFASIRGEGLGWELQTDRAAAAFNLFFSLLSAGRHDEAMPYYYLISELVDGLRTELAREGGLDGLQVPPLPPFSGIATAMRFLGQQFPFDLARRNPPRPLASTSGERKINCLDVVLQMQFCAVRALASDLMETERNQEVKGLFLELVENCSTDAEFARLAELSRDLVMRCSRSDARATDGVFYLRPLESYAEDPRTVFFAAEAAFELVSALAGQDRFPEAMDVFRRIVKLPYPDDSDDWKARSAATIVTAYLERPGDKTLSEMEKVYETVLPLRDSPVVRQCRLFVETNILPFYLVKGDPGRISDVYGRITGSSDCSQTGLEMKLAASTNLVSYYAAGGRLDEARRHFSAIDTDVHREPPFLPNWARAAAALCAGIYNSGDASEAWLLVSEIDRYSHDPDVEECLGRLRSLMGNIPPRTCH
ncbi:MAG: hypothetical protein LBQ79_12020 [Deltaproteobacteria bacterium]|jgi:tetratricopeptide (TPR) repeat protein|nr:hypothetical protein [Deltaproteobacteria bacterium]